MGTWGVRYFSTNIKMKYIVPIGVTIRLLSTLLFSITCAPTVMKWWLTPSFIYQMTSPMMHTL